jgi:hypothetical protein
VADRPIAKAAYFREKAQECRELLKVAAAPGVIMQLQIWIREFDEQAERIEQHGRRAVSTADLP